MTSFFTTSLFDELLNGKGQNDRWHAVYRIHAPTMEEAQERARAAAIEQTIECPYILVENTPLADTVVGQIDAIVPDGNGYFLASISFCEEAVGDELSELINMLFGNTSLAPDIRLMAFRLTPRMYNIFSGPKFGREGIRRLTGIPKGPILMSAIKPVGSSTETLANMVYKLALGGCSIIKDDHSLFNQSYSRFTDRVKACVEAVKKAEAETGNPCLYVANVSADGEECFERAYEAQELGAGGVMLAPGLMGFTPAYTLSQNPDFNLPIFFHPSMAGPLVTSENSGISPYCYFGQMTRIAGADATIFTSFNGRFAYTKECCQLIARATGDKMGPLKKAFPTPAGGMKWKLFPAMYEAYGEDTLFLVGGDLLTHGKDLTESARFFRGEIEKL